MPRALKNRIAMDCNGQALEQTEAFGPDVRHELGLRLA